MKTNNALGGRVLAWALALGVTIGLVEGVPIAQDRPVKNPREGNAEAIRTGERIFGSRCAECHGVDAKGVRGPDLTILWDSGASDGRFFESIRRGVPGTEMPGTPIPDDDVWAVLAYLLTLKTPVPSEPSTGNNKNGERTFWATCGSCHRVNDRGGRLGPDLSRVGSSRSRAALVREIRDASASIVAGYKQVTLVTRNDQQIRGAKKAEDAFSIQIMDTRERLQGYVKADLRELVSDPRSLMPSYGVDQLNDRDLDDLLGYLSTLRGPDASRR